MKITRKQRGIVAMIVLAVSLALLHLYIQSKNIDLKYEYARQKIKFQKIYNQNRYLSNLAAKRSSLKRIEEIARKKLGMEYPPEVKYIIVSGEADTLWQ